MTEVETFDWHAHGSLDQTTRDFVRTFMTMNEFKRFCETQRDAAQRNFANVNPVDFARDEKDSRTAHEAYFQYAQEMRLLVRFWNNLLEFCKLEQEAKEQALAKQLETEE